MENPKSWDIFCSVVDNYGDIGVCWRLSRQLAAEYGLQVRLWIDDLAAFRRIWPEIAVDREVQQSSGVEVRHWARPFPAVEAADVVVEAFACDLPDCYLHVMAARTPAPRWINLEYLSAEDWVGECHGLASPSPRLPLTRHFFFPGFAPNTGGVLQEWDLERQRRAFQLSAGAQADFWQELGMAPAHGEEARISLFCYPGSRAEELFECWHEQGPVTCLVPEGIAGEAIAVYFGQSAPPAGGALRRGSLEVRILPFLAQDRFDRLLWACDCNFVRGEDSFVRAQWALRPMVWQPYPQAEGSHLHKLAAFLRHYCHTLPAEAGSTVADFWNAWSRGKGMGAAWPAYWAQQGLLVRHAESWAAVLRNNGDLAAKLVQFCSVRL
ncbi:MAG: hypothetical protein EFKGCFLK_02616 [Rhodocyclaceae bacterium]|nr:MAG: elongation factor P maturation arginine rhamnosyltransferase EarP [Rhodocyclaceae bacterium]MBE7422516.1 elongation factor P maturation arginine rhamnosyltransferase EarP [Zoogloeaceae bacterium]MBV6408995.1 hypothetical protein [Rhodocyclaceae bacterium]MCK6382875.1 elongation factor P maturation arginine rhamnosyltransferase EarP [Rhodocyclaceae bacterium]CAG0931698.1 hypothetical protein RHDC3_01959 [Rhodocyclaceae bacterium]